jgi:hypothetical protein
MYHMRRCVERLLSAKRRARELPRWANHRAGDAHGRRLARRAQLVFEKSNSLDGSAWAQSFLARNLLSAGHLREAQSAAAKAVSLSQKYGGRTTGFEAVLADVRVKSEVTKRGGRAKRAWRDAGVGASTGTYLTSSKLTLHWAR